MRTYQRGTSAHNCLAVDGCNSSEVWGGFRVARRAKVRLWDCPDNEIMAEHNGYTRLPGKPVHVRRVICSDDQLQIVDTVAGSGLHLIETFWYLHPDFQSMPCRSDSSFLSSDGLNVTFNTSDPYQEKDAYWSVEFGQRLPTTLLHTFRRVKLPHEIITTLHWKPSSSLVSG